MTELTTRFNDWMATNDADNPATAAATVVVLRDTPAGPEVLMVQRNAKGTFANNWVFPGGKLDPEDWADDHDDPIAASRRAASREALEESDVDISPNELVPFSHWMPPTEVPRRFATWFFVGKAPAGTAGEVTIDGGEIVDHLWVRPADALAEHAAGRVELVPPTWITLFDLAPAATATDAIESATHAEPRFYLTRMIPSDPRTVLWHEDASYETGDLATPGHRHRLTMTAGGWSFERTEGI